MASAPAPAAVRTEPSRADVMPKTAVGGAGVGGGGAAGATGEQALSAEVVWQRVQAAAAGSAAKRALVAQVQLLTLDAGRVVLGTSAVAHSMVSGQQRLLADLLQQALGRAVQVQIKPAEAPAGGGGAGQVGAGRGGAMGGRAGEPARGGPGSTGPGSTGPGSAGAGPAGLGGAAGGPMSRGPGSGGGGAGGVGEGALREHPLVRTAMDLFPQARVVEVRAGE